MRAAPVACAAAGRPTPTAGLHAAAPASARSLGPASAGRAARKRVEVLATRPHDPSAFTQGLVLAGGRLYESTGLRGRSTLREIDLDSGQVRRLLDLPAALFGEGLAAVEDRLVQLTWTAGVARIYERDRLALVGQWRYRGQGWGLCHDGRRFVMSDGSSRLSFRDERSFAEIGGVEVLLDGRKLPRLNELECVGASVWANVWETDWIVEIDPESGAVRTLVDASGLLSATERARADVLNGIAYDPRSGTFWLTGKLWPRIFEVRFVAP